MKDDCWLPVKYSLETIPNEKIDNNIFMQNSAWAEIDYSDFKDKLSLVLKNKKIKNLALKQRKHILDKFSQSKINDMYSDLLKEI